MMAPGQFYPEPPATPPAPAAGQSLAEKFYDHPTSRVPT